MSNALQIAQKLSRLGTDVFVTRRTAENLFGAIKDKLNQSELKVYVSEMDDFIGAEIEVSVGNIEDPIIPTPSMIKEEPREETSEEPLEETLYESWREIPPATKQHNLAEVPAGNVSTECKESPKKNMFPCSECRKSYKSQPNLRQHIRDWHYKWKKHACQLCNKKFARRSSLRQHQFVHTREKPFGCNICNDSFKSNFYLKVHRLKYHSKDDSRCRSCNKKLPNELELRFHEMAHEGNECFVCRTCNMRFLLSFELDQHKCPLADIEIDTESHRQKPPPTPKKPANSDNKVCCKVCKKTLSRRYVKRHEDVYHFNVRLYECHICDKAFGSVVYLNRHVEYVHFGVKSNICGLCQKGFVRKGGLRRHLKLVHKNEAGDDNDLVMLNENNNNNNNMQQG